MKYNLLKIFRNELFDEAKRLVPICYDDNDLLNCSYDIFKVNIDKKYKLFETDLHMMTVSLCIMKSEGKKYKSEQINYKNLIDHHLKVIKGKKEMYNEDLYEIADILANDMIKNFDDYIDETLYSLIPNLTQKYAKFHNDSVDWECIVMILEKILESKKYFLNSTYIRDLEKIG